MANMAEIEPETPVPPPSTPEKAYDPADVYDEDDESVSESESVTTEDVLNTIRPRNMPAIRVQAYLDLPAWFVVLTSYFFALGLGIFATSSSCK